MSFAENLGKRLLRIFHGVVLRLAWVLVVHQCPLLVHGVEVKRLIMKMRPS